MALSGWMYFGEKVTKNKVLDFRSGWSGGFIVGFLCRPKKRRLIVVKNWQHGPGLPPTSHDDHLVVHKRCSPSEDAAMVGGMLGTPVPVSPTQPNPPHSFFFNRSFCVVAFTAWLISERRLSERIVPERSSNFLYLDFYLDAVVDAALRVRG